MARPHIEFIHSQTIPWKLLGEGASRPGARGKSLSFDPATRAASTILDYPSGWRMDRPHYLECDEELFVLRSRVNVGAMEYRAGDYAYLPAGMPRPEMSSDDGATVLTFFEGPHRSVFEAPPDDLYDPTRLVARIDTGAMAWSAPGDPVIAATANDCGRKSLRRDPSTGESTWILKMGPDNPHTLTAGRTERHPVVEEFFMLENEITMTCGVLKPGASFWRPPGIEHGPVGTLTGFVGFFRCKGGPLSTQWSDDAFPIDWAPAYAPALPERLREIAFQSYDPALSY